MIHIKRIKNRAEISKNWIRHSILPLAAAVEILQKNRTDLGWVRRKVQYQKIWVKFNNQKNVLVLNQQKEDRCECAICGLKVTYVAIERIDQSVSTHHFNFYTVHPETKKEIYFNIDHIHPKSKGGTNGSLNLQLTCQDCNTLKADYSPIPSNQLKFPALPFETDFGLNSPSPKDSARLKIYESVQIFCAQVVQFINQF